MFHALWLVGFKPECKLDPSRIPPLLNPPQHVPLPFEEAMKYPDAGRRQPFWSLELEMHYQLFDKWGWYDLTREDVRDADYADQIVSVLKRKGADAPRVFVDYDKAVQKWTEIAARRLVRWERLLALPNARAAFIGAQLKLHPGWTATDVLLHSTDMERIVPTKAPPCPAGSIWPVPLEHPLGPVPDPPSIVYLRWGDPDLQAYTVHDQRIFFNPPVPVRIIDALAGAPNCAASTLTLVDNGVGQGPSDRHALHHRRPWTVC